MKQVTTQSHGVTSHVTQSLPGTVTTLSSVMDIIVDRNKVA